MSTPYKLKSCFIAAQERSSLFTLAVFACRSLDWDRQILLQKRRPDANAKAIAMVSNGFSDCYWILDGGMRIVIKYLKVLESIIENRGWLSLDDQFGQRSRLARELFAHAVDLIEVDVAIAAGPDEISRFKITLLRHHMGEQSILGDVEDLADRTVRASLIEQAGKPSVRNIELKERVTGGQGGAICPGERCPADGRPRWGARKDSKR